MELYTCVQKHFSNKNNTDMVVTLSLMEHSRLLLVFYYLFLKWSILDNMTCSNECV